MRNVLMLFRLTNGKRGLLKDAGRLVNWSAT